MKKFNYWRLLPIVIILLGLVLFFVFRLEKYLSFPVLQEQRTHLLALTQAHFFLTSLVFILLYIVAVAFSFPGATLLTLMAGFLFGVVSGTIYVVVAATIGASLIFLAAKTAFGNFLEKKASGWIKKLEHGFQKDAFGYLLFLRLLPLFPFWLINIVPAVLNVRLRTYFIATLLGIIPGTAVYVAVGNGLGAVFDQGGTPDLGIIFKPAIIIPLALLALLSIVPVLYKKFKQ